MIEVKNLDLKKKIPEIGDRIGFLKKGKLLLELTASKMKKMDLKELYFQFLSER